jgi:hypothetical protein
MTENDKNNKYQNGKIYTIRSHNFDKYYIGSTCIRLSQRFYAHEKTRKDFLKTGNKRHSTSCNMVLEKGDCYIELLENFPCNSKEELRKREGELIRLHKKDLVNIRIEDRNTSEWRNDNKEKLVKDKKEYYINNFEKISATKKAYWHGGYGKLRDDKRKNDKVRCECCDIELRKDSLSDHLKSKRHLNNLPKEVNNKITL